MPTVTARFPEDLNDDIEDLLGYNDEKSEFLRQAAREKLARSGLEKYADELGPDRDETDDIGGEGEGAEEADGTELEA